MKELLELVKKNRSYRRFYQEERITKEQVLALIELARNTASGANRQPIKYKIVTQAAECERVFKHLAWAGYYTDWEGPEEGERPSAYILLATPTGTNAQCDIGIAAQTILLGATQAGFGGCMLANIKRDLLAKELQIPEDYKIDLCVALGKPKEEVVLEDVAADADMKYYRDANQVQHVPKKRLEEILFS